MEAYYNSIQDAKGVLCGSTRCQFRNYQIHFVEQRFWQFRAGCQFSRQTKLRVFAAKTGSRVLARGKQNRSLSEKNRIARTTANPRASARKKDETLGADRTIPFSVPEHLACEGAEEFLAAACEVSAIAHV